VHSGAFSYTNSKVLFAIKCKQRYVIVVFLAIDSDTDIKTQGSQEQEVKLKDQIFSKFHDILSVSRGSKHRKCTFFCAYKS